MNPATFEYHKADSLDQAIALLVAQGDGAKLLAGGHSLLPLLKLRLAQPSALIDIGGLDDLRGVRLDGGTIRIGALTTHHQIEIDEILRERCPLLPETARVIGDRQVRNRGTIGGALAHADPAADFPAAILALDAELVARGPAGERTIAAGDFFVDLLTTALNPDEILTEIRVPLPAPRTGASYQKLANQASGYATVGVAAVVTLGSDGRCAAAAIGVTGAGAVPVRADAVERVLVGQALAADVVAGAVEQDLANLDLLDDLHASAEYRARVTRGLMRRAVVAAAARAEA